MRGYVLEAPKQLTLMEIEKPVCGENQILVRIDTSCICNGSDPLIWQGHDTYPTPLVFGHEASGYVEEAGSGVTNFTVGDRVVWWFTLGAFADYVVLTPEDICVVKLPPDFDRMEAAAMELVIASARAIRVEDVRHAKVLIVGLGPSGIMMAQRAKALGADWVAGWDLYPMRRDIGLRCGCDMAIDPLSGDAMKQTEVEGGFDVVIDAFGDDAAADTLIRATKLLKDGGKLVLYGHPPSGRRIDSFLIQSKGIDIRRPESCWDAIRDIAAETMEFVMDGRMRVEPIISDCVPFGEMPEALMRVMESPEKWLKIVIDHRQE